MQQTAAVDATDAAALISGATAMSVADARWDD